MRAEIWNASNDGRNPPARRAFRRMPAGRRGSFFSEMAGKRDILITDTAKRR
jgi:hypothetical protein